MDVSYGTTGPSGSRLPSEFSFQIFSGSRWGWAIRRLTKAGAGLLLMAACLQNQPIKGDHGTVAAQLSDSVSSPPDSSLTSSPDEVSNEAEEKLPAATSQLGRADANLQGSKAATTDKDFVTSRSPTANGETRRIRVRTETGKTVVAKLLGGEKGNFHVLLPDGQIGIADAPAFTDDPFRPWSDEQIISETKIGPFSEFAVERTPHYLIFHNDSKGFAEASGRVLEALYKGLIDAFKKRSIPVHQAEFPLVAVIFKSEDDFRAFKPVAKEIQAYYEIYSNRIYFYATSKRDEEAPEVAALRRPQTVAHEGTHQILQNIGIQPRLADWPLWLIEGLAEYCSTPQTTKKGTTWAGLGMINSLHLATIKDINDPHAAQIGGTRPEHVDRPKGMALVEYLVRKTDLTPTDYALVWAMTHYLAVKKVDPFLKYLTVMSAMPAFSPRSPDEQLAAFREAFGDDLSKLDRDIDNYLGKLKYNHALPYYGVFFQQRLGKNNLIKRAAIVSQSPTMIRQWLESVTNAEAEIPTWEVYTYTTRSRAIVETEQWVQSGR